MGTKRRKCMWRKRNDGWYEAFPPDWKARDGGIAFSTRAQLIDFAHGAKMVLKEIPTYRRAW